MELGNSFEEAFWGFYCFWASIFGYVLRSLYALWNFWTEVFLVLYYNNTNNNNKTREKFYHKVVVVVVVDLRKYTFLAKFTVISKIFMTTENKLSNIELQNKEG